MQGEQPSESSKEDEAIDWGDSGEAGATIDWGDERVVDGGKIDGGNNGEYAGIDWGEENGGVSGISIEDSGEVWLLMNVRVGSVFICSQLRYKNPKN